MDYKEKLRLAKEALDSGSYDKETIEYIFPELKESEDERIRKELYKYFRDLQLNSDREFSPSTSIDEILSWLEKQGEQKPANKVELKFEVKKGKWYVCTDTFVSKGKIIAIKGQIYQSKQEDNTITCEDNCLFVDRHDGKASDYFRYWTIQDAKDGDVLANGEMIVIFKHFKDPLYRQHIVAYIGLDICGNIQITDDIWSLGIDKAKPATKEQRDLLFQKMKDAGYEWNFEKKELKKIDDNWVDLGLPSGTL